VPRERLENAAQGMKAEMLRLISDFCESPELPQSLHTILQILSTHAFSQVPLYELLSEVGSPEGASDSDNQLTFNW
jgi:hypothetical protein